MICSKCKNENSFLKSDFDSNKTYCDECYKSISNKPCINKNLKNNMEMRKLCYSKQIKYLEVIDPFCQKCVKGESLDIFFNK
jgi:hypothetical protein